MGDGQNFMFGRKYTGKKKFDGFRVFFGLTILFLVSRRFSTVFDARFCPNFVTCPCSPLHACLRGLFHNLKTEICGQTTFHNKHLHLVSYLQNWTPRDTLYIYTNGAPGFSTQTRTSDLAHVSTTAF